MKNRTIAELAAEQGVGPIMSVSALAIDGLTEEEADAFMAASYEPHALDVERLGQVLYEMGVDDLDLPDAHKLAAHIVARYAAAPPSKKVGP